MPVSGEPRGEGSPGVSVPSCAGGPAPGPAAPATGFLPRVTGRNTPADRVAWMVTHARAMRGVAGARDGRGPVDLGALCEKLWVEVRADPDVECGHLLFRSGGRSIILVPSAGDARATRFSIAHEIGHLLLCVTALTRVPDAGERTRLLAHGACGEEEELCDRFARELLLPSGHVRRELARTEHPTLDGVLALADEADVGLLPAAHHAVECHPRLTLLYFRYAVGPAAAERLELQWQCAAADRRRGAERYGAAACDQAWRVLAARRGGTIAGCFAHRRPENGYEDLRHLGLGSTPLWTSTRPFRDGVLALVCLPRAEVPADPACVPECSRRGDTRTDAPVLPDTVDAIVGGRAGRGGPAVRTAISGGGGTCGQAS